MKTNQFRATMLVLLMSVISLGMLNAQSLTVSGIVTDAGDGSAMTGCTVQVKGTNRGTISGINGKYSIRANKGEILEFSYIGYKKLEKDVKSSQLNVALEANELLMEECIVVGYGSQQKRSICGATSIVANLRGLP